MRRISYGRTFLAGALHAIAFATGVQLISAGVQRSDAGVITFGGILTLCAVVSSIINVWRNH